MKQARPIGRRFPDYGWAWPSGGLDQLLKAVLFPDDQAADRLAWGWLDSHAINDASFAEHRLLAALAERHGKRLASHPAYPRMAGLQKMLWSRSRLAYREARPVLTALSAAGCPVMLLKGASRVALDASTQRARTSHDIDILVRPENMEDALDLLLAAGWTASTGAGPLYLKSRIASFRALNFFKGFYGDLDLHQSAYHPSHASPEDDQGLWRRTVEATLDGVELLVPSPADRIALAIGHSGLDAHAHSDWLVDIDWTIRRGDVDWTILAGILRARRLFVPAAVPLSYLSRQLGTPAPQGALAEIVENADRAGLVSRASILEAKPRGDFGLLSGLARGLVKQFRLSRGSFPQPGPKETAWRARVKRVSPAGRKPIPSAVHTILIPAEIAREQPVPVEIIVRIAVPAQRRRFEFELSTNMRHHARLRYRKHAGSSGVRELRFRGSIEIDAEAEKLTLEARPSRHFRNWDNPEDVARHGLAPFTLISAAIGPCELPVNSQAEANDVSAVTPGKQILLG